MKSLLKRSLWVMLSIMLLTLFSTLAFAEQTTIKDLYLTVEFPDGYTVLNENNISDDENTELIENFGYTEASFKSYLSLNNIKLFAAKSIKDTQYSLKCWKSDFSNEVEELSTLSTDALKSVAGELITLPGAKYKTVTLNGMKFFEVQTSGKDSGGDFCAVQYITVRNKNIFAISALYSGTLNDKKINDALSVAQTLKITNTNKTHTYDVSDIIEIVFIGAIILLAAVAIIIVLISFIKDIKSKKNNPYDESDYIERRKR